MRDVPIIYHMPRHDTARNLMANRLHAGVRKVERKNGPFPQSQDDVLDCKAG